MAIKSYEEGGKKLFEVYINGFDVRGRRVQKRKRGIESMRKAQTVEFEIKRKLAQLKEEAVPYRWDEWVNECLKRMKLTLKPSTIFNYELQINKWIMPHWRNLEVQQINRKLVYETIF